MNDSRLSRRYAKSLIDLAIERNETEAVFNDMKLISQALHDSRELASFLKNPIINTDKKQHVITALFAQRVTTLTASFLKIIISKKRESYLRGIAQSFIEMYREMKGIVAAQAITPVKLDEKLTSEILSYLTDETKRKVELTEKIDPSIIGGFILRWGDKQVDASVSRKLRLLRMNFKENLYLKDY